MSNLHYSYYGAGRYVASITVRAGENRKPLPGAKCHALLGDSKLNDIAGRNFTDFARAEKWLFRQIAKFLAGQEK